MMAPAAMRMLQEHGDGKAARPLVDRREAEGGVDWVDAQQCMKKSQTE